jgi:putative addiction module component (TIGR02574 family)
MSKAEIMRELPKLGPEERREIFDLICEIEERALLGNGGPSAEEKQLLDRELEEYRANPQAGSTWDEVEARLRKQTPS